MGVFKKMDQPIKVMHVLRPVLGGMRQHLIGLINHMKANEVETIVVCPPEPAGFSTQELPCTKIVTLPITGEFNLKNDFRISHEILALARREEVDIIHAHGVKAGLLCIWASLNNRKSFSVICTFHNQFRKVSNPLKNLANQLIVRFLAAHVHHIITVSQAIRKELVDYLKVYPYKITCIYNGVDLAKCSAAENSFTLRDQLGISRYSICVSTVARLIPQKGISVLIKAAQRLCKKHNELYFIIVGDGPFRESLELEAAGAGLKKRMFFLGFRDDVPAILAQADIFALPTLEEGFSIVSLEAMAEGKPVVASEVGGLPEVITPETGITVIPNSPEQLETALDDLICNPAKRKQMGDAALERARRVFTLEKMVNEHLILYRSILNR